jgi:hypothetical protein
MSDESVFFRGMVIVVLGIIVSAFFVQDVRVTDLEKANTHAVCTNAEGNKLIRCLPDGGVPVP